GFVNLGESLKTQAAIFQVLAVDVNRESADIKDHAIFKADGTDFTKERKDGLWTRITRAKKIEIARGAKGCINPGHREHGALEDEAGAMRRDAETVKQAFQ